MVVLLINNLFKLYSASFLIHREIEHHFEKQAVSLGLSALELQVLWFIATFSGATMVDLVISTGRTRQELESVLEVLENDGLITWVCFTNSRKRVLKCLERGTALIEKAEEGDGLKHSFNRVENSVAVEFFETASSLAKALRGYGISEFLTAEDAFKNHRCGS